VEPEGIIDIMGHAAALISGLGRGMTFDYEEYRIATRTTFKSIFKGRIPTEEEQQKAGFLSPYPDVSALIADMDRLGYDKIVACATKMWSPYYHFDFIMDCPVEDLADVVDESDGRLIGATSYNPFRIDDSLREIEWAVRERGFGYVWFHPLSYGLPPNDRRFYPLYAKCSELQIPVGLQVGHSAEVLPSEGGRPMIVDEVAIDFPNLKINLSHTGWPWVEEWISMLWRHPNVYGDISSYYPKGLDEKLVRFMDSSRGRDKVLFGTNSFSLERCQREFLEMEFDERTVKRVLRQNAVEFLGLE
jgi:predicted TIM-barrel fold metal-dependent hydrolase